ncbi:MAG: hypothetical protein DRQ89_14350 [Epsilonproteobacteria bacterium]|nr:MAG: hypothetical protein DRQ89_14350 [Campylobacterota bacterium]
MFNNECDNEEKPKHGFETVLPLKDWHIVFNDINLKLVEGEEIEVPVIFLEGLRTEQVIK